MTLGELTLYTNSCSNILKNDMLKAYSLKAFPSTRISLKKPYVIGSI